jgi:plastocyanin
MRVIVIALLHAFLMCVPARGILAQSPAVGAIEGTVSYHVDPARPWRYARYYVKRASNGELAEAVVALRARPVSVAARQLQTVTIDQQNFQFTPETIAVRRGDSVRFTNADGATHNVQTASDLAAFNVTMVAGDEHTVRLDRAGGIREPITIGCVFHSAMRAWIFVFDHPWYELTPASGKFRLAAVPPGSYELEMVHPAGALRWRKRVEIQPGQTLQVDIRVSADDKVGSE